MAQGWGVTLPDILFWEVIEGWSERVSRTGSTQRQMNERAKTTALCMWRMQHGVIPLLACPCGC